jgi:hypothetical protein
LKKWLRAQTIPATVDDLNALLDEFRGFYNQRRPHKELHGATPAEFFTATQKARPADQPLPEPVFVSRHTVGEKSGNVFVPPYKVNVGRRWAGHECDSIRVGDHIAIFSGAALVREFIADPTRNYQPGDKTTRTYRTREPQPAS